MGMLFVISRTVYERREFDIDIELAEKEDGVIFIQDGVLILKRVPEELVEIFERAKKRNVKFYALKEDLEARGVKPKEGFEIVDYDGFLDLLKKYDKAIN